MRLVKQSILYFKEGNSDKVYEIDLCDVGNDKYVVNFRYGRRNAKLKEGSKTPVPVSLAEAEKLFSELQDEKISKGYTASESGISSIPTSNLLPTPPLAPALCRYRRGVQREFCNAYIMPFRVTLLLTKPNGSFRG
jgi:predicted DNA-binding WGR domain protein